MAYIHDYSKEIIYYASREEQEEAHLHRVKTIINSDHYGAASDTTYKRLAPAQQRHPDAVVVPWPEILERIEGPSIPLFEL